MAAWPCGFPECGQNLARPHFSLKFSRLGKLNAPSHRGGTCAAAAQDSSGSVVHNLVLSSPHPSVEPCQARSPACGWEPRAPESRRERRIQLEANPVSEGTFRPQVHASKGDSPLSTCLVDKSVHDPWFWTVQAFTHAAFRGLAKKQPSPFCLSISIGWP